MENQRQYQQQQLQSQKVTTVARCAICGTTEQLLRCAKCRSIYYCSSSHQHIDWPTHKAECKLMARQKKNNNNRIQQLQKAVAATSLDSRNGSENGIGALSMNYVGAGITANCSTAQMMSPVDPQQLQKQYQSQQQQQYQQKQQHQTNENVNWPDVIDNMLAVLPPDFGSESTPQIINVSNSNYANGLMINGSGGGGVGAIVQNQMADMLQMQAPVLLSALQQQQHQPHMQISQQQQQQHQHQQQIGQPMPPFMLPPSNQTGQSEKSSSYKIGLADANFIGHVSEDRYDDLCRNIISDMNEYGLSVVDDFLGPEKGLNILNEVHRMYNAGVFQDGQLVNNIKANGKDQSTIRGDKITWVKGLEPGCSNVGYLINQIDAVIYRANNMNNNGSLGEYNIKERTKAMVACYPGSGAHYIAHVDNPNKDGRVITAIYYLNINWNASESGGLLRIFPSGSYAVADIAPKFDRLIFFWSDKRNPHEVQPAHRTRYAITVWYFDANEREAALNRCRYQNYVSSTNSSASSTSAPSSSASASASRNATEAAAAAPRTKTNTAAVLSQAAAAALSQAVAASANANNSKQEEADSTTSAASSVAPLGNRPTLNAAVKLNSTNQSKICT